MAIFWHLVFSASCMQLISDLRSKCALSHIMCGSMVDIQSVTTEIRRGKKKKKEEEETTVAECNAGLIGRPQ